MKKTLLVFAFVTVLIVNAFGQSIILSENFNTYDSTAASIPANWTMSFTGPTSYYTSIQSSGPSGPNSYKFGVDGATVTTPVFSGGDSLHFWGRGNGADTTCKLTIYYTADLLTWLTFTTIQPIVNAPTYFNYELPFGTQQLKFVYNKTIGNFAFDDFSVTANTAGLSTVSKKAKPYSIYPIPTNGLVYINFVEPVNAIKFSVFNLLGAEVKNVTVEKMSNQKYRLNVLNQAAGYYFIRMQSDKFIYTSRVTVAAGN